MHPQKPPRSSLLILAAATLGLAACGDDGSGTESKGSGSSGSLTGTAATQTDSTDTATAGTGNSATDSAGSDGATDSATSNPTTSPTTTATTSATTTATSDDTTMGAVSTGTTAEASSSTGPLGPVCGNGLLEEGEDCDDGNAAPLDTCSNECTKVPCDQQEGNPGDLLSFIWIANSGEGTVSKIETKTGIEVGRYRVQGGNPSRTSVNLLGDVAVSSRDPGGVTKIAARIDDCVDKNGDNVIQTSKGPNDILALGQDECVLWTKVIPSPGYGYGPRATAWEGAAPDPDTCISPPPRLWFGWMDNANVAHFERVDGTTGVTLDTVTMPWGGGYSPYGGAVNAAGDFFATGLNTQPAIKIDAKTLEITNFGIPQGCKYGMTLDNEGNIWNGGCIGGHVFTYNMQEAKWTDIGWAQGDRVNGVMADAEGNIWGAGSNPCRLVHVDAKTKSFVNANIPIPGCSSPWGVSIDYEGYVWIVDMGNQAFKIDPDTYELKLTVTGLVNPYTYSDMTGAALKAQVIPQ
jgi:cysteine-rich repeat protein